MGGVVYDFDQFDENKRSQHYEWLVPIFYRAEDGNQGDLKCTYLQVRTTSVKRTLVPNVSTLEFGEIPIAFKQT